MAKWRQHAYRQHANQWRTSQRIRSDASLLDSCVIQNESTLRGAYIVLRLAAQAAIDHQRQQLQIPVSNRECLLARQLQEAKILHCNELGCLLCRL